MKKRMILIKALLMYKVKPALVFAFFCLLGAMPSAGESPLEPDKRIVPLEMLFTESEKFDGQVVAVVGEAIGDIMGDGDLFWLNIKDGNFFIGIVMDSAQIKEVEYLGRYKIRGDILKITGTFYSHSPTQYGNMAIHAESVSIIQQGILYEENISSIRVLFAFILGFATLFFILYDQRRAGLQDNDGRP